ncbi:protein MGARP [Silurus meridionalis]|uniref:Protein MGARP N-terminal domain-containing protein n=1 Tax=Silurus meridionalis TaxID=175797 RepID=A0A8T0BNN9_SILME|nr:protein MGARP [Silurus meridionalis]XP_046705162.1 protein MGARP [Silurus meridionalis]KAF7707006.1 hypothetical protein HF521_018224 [Silurus meridionalis]
MNLCRALQRFSPLTRNSMTHRVILHRDVVPRRLMSSVPGSSGENLIFVVICGGAFAAASTYAYRTVSTDSARFTDRITEIRARPKDEWKPKPWPPQSAEEASEVAEVESPADAEDAVEAAPAVIEVVAEAKNEKPSSVVETVAETVAVVVEEAGEEVAAVAHKVEKIAEEVEAAAKELESPALSVAEEATAEINETTVEEAPVTPAVEKVPESLIVAASEDQLSGEAQVVADVTTPDEATAPPAALEEPEPKHEFVVVVLEGAPKSEKKHKVLGVSPMVGRIIPALEDEEPAEQITGQAPPA